MIYMSRAAVCKLDVLFMPKPLVFSPVIALGDLSGEVDGVEIMEGAGAFHEP
jgi:hypothetical protein